PPLNFQILIARNALYNPALFYEQFEFIWLISVVGVAVKVGCKIDASRRHPVALHDSLVRRPVFIFPVYFGEEIHHMRHLFLLHKRERLPCACEYTWRAVLQSGNRMGQIDCAACTLISSYARLGKQWKQ